jgi:hypothetical protein
MLEIPATRAMVQAVHVTIEDDAIKRDEYVVLDHDRVDRVQDRTAADVNVLAQDEAAILQLGDQAPFDEAAGAHDDAAGRVSLVYPADDLGIVGNVEDLSEPPALPRAGYVAT